MDKMLKVTIAFVAYVIAVTLVVFPVFADPLPRPRPDWANWFAFALEATVGEVAAWLIGAELLWRLVNRAMERKKVYQELIFT